MIELRGIVKCYGTRTVFNGIDLFVSRGEFVALTGSSGSGKSTLLNLIGGMDLPDSGSIIVDSEEVSQYNDEQLTAYRRKKIGFVFQFFNLLPNISVYENIEIPLLLNGNSGYGPKIREYLGLVGLSERAKDHPSSLSGGEQQRVAIVRALVHEPRVIIADEPTGNLDSVTGKSIMELMAKAARMSGTTVVLATHNQAAAGFADRILRISDGRVLAEGTK